MIKAETAIITNYFCHENSIMVNIRFNIDWLIDLMAHTKVGACVFKTFSAAYLKVKINQNWRTVFWIGANTHHAAHHSAILLMLMLMKTCNPYNAHM